MAGYIPTEPKSGSDTGTIATMETGYHDGTCVDGHKDAREEAEGAAREGRPSSTCRIDPELG